MPQLPRYVVDRELFWDWWGTVNIPINRIQPDSRGNGGGYNGEFWDGVTIWQKPDYQRNIVWRVNYHPNQELFSGLVDRILADLPWFGVHGITLWSNKSRIPPHQDGLPRDPFPSAPRISLLDECADRTFYLASKQKFQMFTPDLQEGPNLFLFNNESFFHGARDPGRGRKVLVRVDGPLVDPEGLKKYLLEQVEAGAKYEIAG